MTEATFKNQKNKSRRAAATPSLLLLVSFLSQLSLTACLSTNPAAPLMIVKRDRHGQGPVVDIGSMRTAADIVYEEEERAKAQLQETVKKRASIEDEIRRAGDEMKRLEAELRILEGK